MDVDSPEIAQPAASQKDSHPEVRFRKGLERWSRTVPLNMFVLNIFQMEVREGR